MDDVAGRLAAATLPAPRPHQRAALDAFRAHRDEGRFHFVMPPGSGKTVLGSLIGRELGRRMLVLVPNTAIQSQWLQLWRGAGGVSVADGRELAADVSVLTYQALATFDDEATGESPSARLHPDAAAMVERLRSGHYTLVLDEAHHLAQVWGELLAEVLGEAQALVVALTATPRESLSQDEAALVESLFGPVVHAVSTPALVRDGVLAPYRELPWFVTPTPAEQEYLARSALRWQELLAAVTAPDFAGVGLFAYVDRAWVGHEGVSWSHIERTRPDLARAVLRLAHNGMCAVPQDARLRDEHRQPVQVDDWVAVLADYGRTVLAPADEPGWERLRAGLRSLGWTLTVRGVRKGQSAIDRVLARSAAKAVAAGHLVGQEYLIRGDDLHAIVLTDVEHAQAAPPADIRGVLAEDAGTAWEALAEVQAANPALRVVLMTGSSVGGTPGTLAAIAPGGTRIGPGPGGMASLTGTWGPRDWVPHVTELFQRGEVDVLVGTRGLLGEGWDAPAANVLIDLTAATTATAVVQVRGRAIRRDPRRADKVAHVWSVTAVDDGHPRGDLDHRRLVAKHRGYLAPDTEGHIVAGVEHLDPRISRYAAPAASVRAAINADALAAAGRLEATRAAWAIGQPYRDVVETTVRVRAGRSSAAGAPEPAVPRRPVLAGGAATGTALAAGVLAAVVGLPAAGAVGVALAAGLVAAALSVVGRRWRERRAQRRLGFEGLLVAFGRAIAASLPGAVPEQVRAAPGRDGGWAVRLDGADAALSASFATALEQVVSPVDYPRYIIDRRVRGRAVMWHAVPDVFGVNKASAEQFAQAWRRFVGRGRLLYTGSPEGAGVAQAVRALDPLDVSSALFAQWG
jgi:superfamily II DNA or RNA helicase